MSSQHPGRHKRSHRAPSASRHPLRRQMIALAVAVLLTSAWWAATRPTPGKSVPPGPSNARETTQIAFPSAGDAYVSAAQPELNAGSKPLLRIGSSPPIRSYLSFYMQGISGPITRAMLRLWSDLADQGGVAVHAVHGSWNAKTITAAKAPAIGHAAKKTGRAVKKTAKKGTHAVAKKTRQGAEKIENKTD